VGNIAGDNLTVSSDLIFDQLDSRVYADMSNADHSKRLIFQTSTADSDTMVALMPSGTGTAANFVAYSTSDIANASVMYIGHGGAMNQVRLQSTRMSAGGAFLPIVFMTSNEERMYVQTDGTVSVVGNVIAGGNVSAGNLSATNLTLTGNIANVVNINATTSININGNPVATVDDATALAIALG